MVTLPKEPILELRGVSKSFGAVQAVKQVSWQVYPGEVAALVGDNGAGKSTMIKLITGALMIDEGDILVRGQPVHIRVERRVEQHTVERIHQAPGRVADPRLHVEVVRLSGHGFEPIQIGFACRIQRAVHHSSRRQHRRGCRIHQTE